MATKLELNIVELLIKSAKSYHDCLKNNKDTEIQKYKNEIQAYVKALFGEEKEHIPTKEDILEEIFSKK